MVRLTGWPAVTALAIRVRVDEQAVPFLTAVGGRGATLAAPCSWVGHYHFLLCQDWHKDLLPLGCWRRGAVRTVVGRRQPLSPIEKMSYRTDAPQVAPEDCPRRSDPSRWAGTASTSEDPGGRAVRACWSEAEGAARLGTAQGSGIAPVVSVCALPHVYGIAPDFRGAVATTENATIRGWSSFSIAHLKECVCPTRKS